MWLESLQASGGEGFMGEFIQPQGERTWRNPSLVEQQKCPWMKQGTGELWESMKKIY